MASGTGGTPLALSLAAGGALKERAIATINSFSERGYGLFEELLRASATGTGPSQ